MYIFRFWRSKGWCIAWYLPVSSSHSKSGKNLLPKVEQIHHLFLNLICSLIPFSMQKVEFSLYYVSALLRKLNLLLLLWIFHNFLGLLRYRIYFTDEVTTPSFWNLIQTIPEAPICGRFTQSMSSSICFLV